MTIISRDQSCLDAKLIPGTSMGEKHKKQGKTSSNLTASHSHSYRNLTLTEFLVKAPQANSIS